MKLRILIFSALVLLGSSLSAYSQDGKEKKNPKELLAKISDFITLEGYGQLAYEYNEAENTNSFYIRRIILFGNVNLHKRFDMHYMFSLGSGFSALEFWGRFKVCDELNIKFGQMKVPYTMESMMSLSKAEIIEGALPVNYIANIDKSDAAFAGDKATSGRDFGLMVEGNLFDYNYTGKKFMTYRLGVFNGEGMNLKDSNKHKDVVFNLDMMPANWLKLTGGAYFGEATAKANIVEDGIVEGSQYTRNRWTAGFEIKTKPIMFRAEYLEGKNGEATTRGAYAISTVTLYKNLDLIGSAAYLKKNTKINGDICRYVAGAEYRFFNRCRMQLQYQREYDAYLHRPNNQIFTQLQIGF